MKNCNFISNVIIILMLLAGIASCGASDGPDEVELTEEEILRTCLNKEEDFCSCFLSLYSDVEEPEKFFPVVAEFQAIINDFLCGINENLPGKQKIEELEKRINEHTCVRAYIEHYTATQRIYARFLCGDFTFHVIYEMDMTTKPMTVTGFQNTLYYKHENNKESIEIPSVAYSLNETSYKWNLGYVGEKNLIAINSDEELENYITCTENDDYPAIDFTRQTLLLAYGQQAYGITFCKLVYLCRSSIGYVLNVDMCPKATAAVTPWDSAIVVDKLDEDIDIEISINNLNITFKR